MNWRMLLYFLTNKVVPSGNAETDELFKLVEEVKKQIRIQEREHAA
jgi:hypothetical protein